MIFQAHHVICSPAKKQSLYAFDLCSDIISCCAAAFDGAIIHILGRFHTTISFRLTIGLLNNVSCLRGNAGNLVSNTDSIVTLYQVMVCIISSHEA